MHEVLFTAESGREISVRATAQTIRKLRREQLSGCPHKHTRGPTPQRNRREKQTVVAGSGADAVLLVLGQCVRPVPKSVAASL